MATIQQLKTQIENTNALGRTNLANKGVELPETATTYDIMKKIGEVKTEQTESAKSIVSRVLPCTYINILVNAEVVDNTVSSIVTV